MPTQLKTRLQGRTEDSDAATIRAGDSCGRTTQRTETAARDRSYKLNDRIKRHNPETVFTVPGRFFLILFNYTDNLTPLNEPAADDNITVLLSPKLVTGRG